MTTTREQRIENLGKCAKKGYIPWNKGLTENDPRVKKYVDGQREWLKTHKIVGCWKDKKRPGLGKILSKILKGQKPWNLGMKGYMSGEKNNFWKGGVSKINRTERANFMSAIEYKKWRLEVFRKDHYSCRICGLQKIYLYADHIKPYSIFPELRLDVGNGQALCEKCHGKKTKEDRKIYQFNSRRKRL